MAKNIPDTTTNVEDGKVTVVFIEQVKQGGVWRTHRVMTKDDGLGLDEYDVDWSRRDKTYYFDKSGSGPDNGSIYLHRLIGPQGRIWLAPGYFCYDGGKSHTHAEINPLVFGYAVLSKYPGDPFADAIEQDCRSCSVCDDNLPVEDLCDHVWWCRTLGWYAGPGADEPSKPCTDPDCEECRAHRFKKESP